MNLSKRTMSSTYEGSRQQLAFGREGFDMIRKMAVVAHLRKYRVLPSIYAHRSDIKAAISVTVVYQELLILLILLILYQQHYIKEDSQYQNRLCTNI